jgi:flagellar hook-associated protein 1 FlgK
MDSRDNLVQQLGQQLGVTVVAGPNNTLDVYTTGGAVLVDGGSSANLTATSGSYGGGSLSIIYQPTGQDITASLSGGTIGGIISSQAQGRRGAEFGGRARRRARRRSTRSNRSASTSTGRSVPPVLGRRADRACRATSNTGSGTLSATITNTGAFIPGNYIVTKTASGYQATNTATGQVSALGNGPSLSLDGMTLAVSGTINIGDSFEVEPTATAAQTLKVANTDPSAIAAASPYVATPGSNLGNVTAGAFSAAASGSLPPARRSCRRAISART